MTSFCPEGWGVYTITYQMPVFGTDPDKPNYGAETIMIVGTQGGKKDAELACKQYHKGCKIVMIQDRMEVAADIKPINKKGKS